MYQYDIEELPEAGGRSPSAPLVTWLLLATNCLIWIVVTVLGGSDNPAVLLNFGAMFAPLVSAGEYWRLLTAMFLHVGVTHLALNGFALFIFGQLVEKAYGRVRFLEIYLLSGLSGSVTSFCFNPISVGAGSSGAVFGVLGALAAFFVAERKLLSSAKHNIIGVLVMSAVSLVYGLATPGIDNWAHLGGFTGGFIIGLAIAPRYKLQVGLQGMRPRLTDITSVSKHLSVLLIVALPLLGGVWLGKLTVPDNPYTHKIVADQYYLDGKYLQALEELEAALSFDEFWGQANYMKGKILAELGNSDSARRSLSKAAKFGDSKIRAEAIAILLTLR